VGDRVLRQEGIFKYELESKIQKNLGRKELLEERKVSKQF
jgi:hypothetical protein